MSFQELTFPFEFNPLLFPFIMRAFLSWFRDFCSFSGMNKLFPNYSS
jgi:hypothetical protein